VTQPPIETDLATEMVAVYQAPLEDFISRRDALAKQLRAEKRRDDAALVKALRKPSGIAWALDGVVHEDPVSIEHLAVAIREAQSGADLRTGLEKVKEAVRSVAAAGARVAVRAGHPIEPNALVTAVQAIIGDETAFAEFRAGRLVDVPEGGGLSLLFALTPNPPSTKATSSASAVPPTTEPVKADPRVELAAAARAEVHRAEKALAEMREQSEHAVESLRDANARLDAAERALEQARAERDARRDDVERTQRHVQSTAANLEVAQRAFEDARGMTESTELRPKVRSAEGRSDHSS
jgi:hypothetical protein